MSTNEIPYMYRPLYPEQKEESLSSKIQKICGIKPLSIRELKKNGQL
jgi:hypothetical protein